METEKDWAEKEADVIYKIWMNLPFDSRNYNHDRLKALIARALREAVKR